MILARIFRALSDPNRLRALAALRGGELCVCQIVALLGLAPSTVSKHMSLLAEAGLVTAGKRGRWVYYQLAEAGSETIGRLLALLPALLDEEARVVADADVLKRILALDPEALCRMAGDAREFEAPGTFLEAVEDYYQMIHPAVARYLAKNAAASGEIEPGRRAELGALTRFIRDRRDRGQSASIVFICTHNSRRSQMAQVWAHIAADYYGVAPVATFSGGSEVTACHPNTLAALTRAGLTVAEVTAGNNPICLLHYRDDGEPIRVFSKRFDDTANPTADFCAVMTCAQADTACPVVSGASLRLALTYEDPKAADGSRDEASVYDARCRQICRELLFVFSTLAATKSPATIDR